MRGHCLVSDQDLPIRVRCIPGQLRIWSVLSGNALVVDSETLDMQPDRYEREEKASFVDFVVFSLEIDRVRCVPERLFLAQNWCAPSYQLCGSAGYRPGGPYRGFESHSLRQVAHLSY